MNIATTSDSIDHHANALANVTQLVADNHDLQDRVQQLEADNHHLKIRLEMKTADDERHLAESNLFRSKLIELATHQANIGLLTVSAQAIVMNINEAINPQAAAHTPALEALEAEFNKGNEAA